MKGPGGGVEGPDGRATIPDGGAEAGAMKKPKKAAVGGTAPDTEGLGGLRPKRARIKSVGRP
ncbi:hypothetical protein [Streptomyces sp. MH13]|uniref:hypothetical protein n=1 Tax=Streptomyces sp. MH13 TaxID=3417651 RepID=UPI003CF93EA0